MCVYNKKQQKNEAAHPPWTKHMLPAWLSSCPIMPATSDSHLTAPTGSGSCQPKHLALLEVSKPLPQLLVGNNGPVFPLRQSSSDREHPKPCVAALVPAKNATLS